MQPTRTVLISLAAFVACAAPPAARGQHTDVLLRVDSGRLVTGGADFVTNTYTVGKRVYANHFDPGLTQFGTLAQDRPGFNGVTDPSLQGTGPLPGSAPVSWAFLPMTHDGSRSTLLHWDPAAGPVDWSTPTGYRLNLLGQNTSISNTRFATGSANREAGAVLWTTEPDGFLHKHREFRLFDADTNSATLPAPGVYLTAYEFSVPGLEPALPTYVLLATTGVTPAALAEAADWVTERADLLALEGDYNSDGAVDAADYVVWRDAAASAAPLVADGDGSGALGEGDYGVWQAHFGRPTPPTPALASAPEPGAATLLLLASPLLALRKRTGGSR